MATLNELDEYCKRILSVANTTSELHTALNIDPLSVRPPTATEVNIGRACYSATRSRISYSPETADFDDCLALVARYVLNAERELVQATIVQLRDLFDQLTTKYGRAVLAEVSEGSSVAIEKHLKDAEEKLKQIHQHTPQKPDERDSDPSQITRIEQLRKYVLPSEDGEEYYDINFLLYYEELISIQVKAQRKRRLNNDENDKFKRLTEQVANLQGQVKDGAKETRKWALLSAIGGAILGILGTLFIVPWLQDYYNDGEMKTPTATQNKLIDQREIRKPLTHDTRPQLPLRRLDK